MDPARTPVLVGVGQLLERTDDPREASEPLALLEAAARSAAADARAGDALLRQIDTCALTQVIAWKAQNAPQVLGERLGARTRRDSVAHTGGETGLTLLNRVCREIAAGEARVALVAGVNNMRTLMTAHARGIQLDWRPGAGTGEPELVGERRWGVSDREREVGLLMPTDVYPLFANALRARRGLSLEEHFARMGRLMSGFSEVAAKNPYAWFPTYRSPEELVTVTETNRMIAFPYPKYLNAVMNTDQASAVIATSAEKARALGVPEERQVWWWGGAEADEAAWYLSERRALDESPAMRATHRTALARAGVSLDAIDRFDFYSCFPVAVEMACEMLGLSEEDPRGFTVTGGLPYAGGPGSSYTLHALASMAERLREAPGAKGLVTGNGWYFTKHSASVLASAPPEALPADVTLPDSPGPTPPLDRADGPATIETYTVIYARDGAPERGIVLGRLDAGGARFLANTPPERGVLEDLVAREGVGRPGRVRHVDGRNVFEPA